MCSVPAQLRHSRDLALPNLRSWVQSPVQEVSGIIPSQHGGDHSRARWPSSLQLAQLMPAFSASRRCSGHFLDPWPSSKVVVSDGHQAS